MRLSPSVSDIVKCCCEGMMLSEVAVRRLVELCCFARLFILTKKVGVDDIPVRNSHRLSALPRKAQLEYF